MPAVYDPVLSWRSRPVDRLWVPYEGFPSNRHAVDILTGFLKSYIKKEKAAQRAREASQPSDAAAGVDAYATFEHRHRDVLDLRGRTLDDQVRAQNDAVNAAARAQHLSEAQYREGAVNYLDVLDSQRTTLQAPRQASQLAGSQAVATVNLIRALGGGWGDMRASDTQQVAKQ